MIDDCSPGTNHFVVVAAVDAGGDLVSRSEQCTVQTCAPVNQPTLQLRWVNHVPFVKVKLIYIKSEK